MVRVVFERRAVAKPKHTFLRKKVKLLNPSLYFYTYYFEIVLFTEKNDLIYQYRCDLKGTSHRQRTRAR